jgi:hypothetical protein
LSIALWRNPKFQEQDLKTNADTVITLTCPDTFVIVID